MCIYIYIYVYTCLSIYLSLSIYIYIYTHICVYIYIYIYPLLCVLGRCPQEHGGGEGKAAGSGGGITFRLLEDRPHYENGNRRCNQPGSNFRSLLRAFFLPSRESRTSWKSEKYYMHSVLLCPIILHYSWLSRPRGRPTRPSRTSCRLYMIYYIIAYHIILHYSIS